MGCLLALLAAFAPRVVLVLVWIFTNLVDRAFSTFIVPFIGLLILPYTTLFYVLAWAPVNGVSGWGWVFVIFGVLCDVSHWASSGYTARQRSYGSAGTI
jgi:uncharacterized membrane protein